MRRSQEIYTTPQINSGITTYLPHIIPESKIKSAGIANRLWLYKQPIFGQLSVIAQELYDKVYPGYTNFVNSCRLSFTD